MNNHAELNMGTGFDYMDKLSHPANQEVGSKAYNNRLLLRTIMQKYGFEGIIETEWWHFTLKDEPFKDQYFNFMVK